MTPPGTHPCDQKDNIEKLFDFHDEKMKQLNVIEVRQAEIQGDVRHIKSRIDNGMSHTIANLNNLLIKLEPIIAHHSKIVSKIEDVGWWISKGLLMALLGVLIWAASHGWKP
jgi:hypothetical protein